jgi:hypothetical protein
LIWAATKKLYYPGCGHGIEFFLDFQESREKVGGKVRHCIFIASSGVAGPSSGVLDWLVYPWV